MTDQPIRSYDATGDVDTSDERVSVLADLKAELAELDVRHETYPVPARPGYEVRYRVSIPFEKLMVWRKGALDKSMPGGINQLRYYSIILANCCEAILRHGVELTADGAPITFASQDLLDLVDADRASAAVRKFYGRDGDVAKAAMDVLADAGYSDDPAAGLGDEVEGPTDG